MDFIAVSESMDVEKPEGEVGKVSCVCTFLGAWFESERRASAGEPSEIQDGTRVADDPHAAAFRVDQPTVDSASSSIRNDNCRVAGHHVRAACLTSGGHRIQSSLKYPSSVITHPVPPRPKPRYHQTISLPA